MTYRKTSQTETMEVQQGRRLAHEHKDLIHDVAYDFYGRRLATCSSDQTIKIWDQGEDGVWNKSAEFKVKADTR